MEKKIVELYEKTACVLPDEIIGALSTAASDKTAPAHCASVIKDMLENARLARERRTALCQDTGTPIFFVRTGKMHRTDVICSAIRKATVIATERGSLRPNNAKALSGSDCDYPVIHLLEHDGDDTIIELLLKGGGSENIGRLYSLPDDKLGAGRDAEGVKRCVIDAVVNAQGKGCPPYLVSIGIGGTQDVATMNAKKGLLREIDDENDDPLLRKLEKELLAEINTLGIGPMGLGGGMTAFAVKMTESSRHPATFFVSVSFSCWAYRKGRVSLR